ncbi:MAG: hypothetical protein ACRDD7_01385 [Peptostreptococcaceae bacterium]
MGQIIHNTIRIYTSSPRKLDWILKYGYNNDKDICAVASGIGDRGTTYILFIATDDLFEAIDMYNDRQDEYSYKEYIGEYRQEESLREY